MPLWVDLSALMTFRPYCLHISRKMPNIASSFDYALSALQPRERKTQIRHWDLPDRREYGRAVRKFSETYQIQCQTLQDRASSADAGHMKDKETIISLSINKERKILMDWKSLQNGSDIRGVAL